MSRPLTLLTAVCIAAGDHGYESTSEEWIAAYQYLIDTGDVWRIEGFFGRIADDLIFAGLCTDSRGHTSYD
jgi:hypothetical protein